MNEEIFVQHPLWGMLDRDQRTTITPKPKIMQINYDGGVENILANNYCNNNSDIINSNSKINFNSELNCEQSENCRRKFSKTIFCINSKRENSRINGVKNNLCNSRVLCQKTNKLFLICLCIWVAILPISKLQAHPLSNRGSNRFTQYQLSIHLSERLLNPCGKGQIKDNFTNMSTNVMLNDDYKIALNAAITQSETALNAVEDNAKDYIELNENLENVQTFSAFWHAYHIESYPKGGNVPLSADQMNENSIKEFVINSASRLQYLLIGFQQVIDKKIDEKWERQAYGTKLIDTLSNTIRSLTNVLCEVHTLEQKFDQTPANNDINVTDNLTKLTVSGGHDELLGGFLYCKSIDELKILNDSMKSIKKYIDMNN